MTSDPAREPAAVEPAAPLFTPRRRGPLGLLLDLFSSVKFGVSMLVVLFVYCSIGSAGIIYPVAPNIFDSANWRHDQMRQWPMFEMTEFEWFHTTFFFALIGLIGANIIVTTLRRIPLTVLSLGVWTIHTGVIVLGVGSIVYFGMKVEGDTVVLRRQLVLQAPGAPAAATPAMVGNEVTVQGEDGIYAARIVNIEPERPLTSADNGPTSFAVDVLVRTPRGAMQRRVSSTDEPLSALPLLGAQVVGGPAQPAVFEVWEQNTATLAAGSGQYEFLVVEVQSAQPAIPAPQGSDVPAVAAQPLRALVRVRAPDGALFARQVTLGAPARDFIPGRGWVDELPEYNGRPLLDEALDLKLTTLPERVSLTLAYQPQDSFWLTDSSALAVRTVGEPRWHERPIEGLPRYNDRIDGPGDVWGGEAETVRPISITVPAASDADPLRTATVRITGYLRYAELEQRVTDGGTGFNPGIRFSVATDGGGTARYSLMAGDPEFSRVGGGMMSISFRWLPDAAAVEALAAAGGGRLRIEAPGTSAAVEVPVPAGFEMGEDAAYSRLEGTDIEYRLRQVASNLALPGGGSINVVVVDLRTPNGEWQRIVADDPARTGDVPRETDLGPGMLPPDESVRTTYVPGRDATITLAAYPGAADGQPPEVRALVGMDPALPATVHALKPGEPARVAPMIQVTLDGVIERARVAVRPRIVPPNLRDRDVDRARYNAMIRVQVSDGDRTQSRWLPFCKYSFDDASLYNPRAMFARLAPEVFELSDGTPIEVMFTSRRLPLPSPVVLDDFILTTRIGGYTGGTDSVRDWTSVLRFATGDGWSQTRQVRVNNPKDWGGLWFFQSYWDPPREGVSAGDVGNPGLTFTGLGVGNRHGVITQLVGSTLIVIGMLYAFYVKPIIRRRRIAAVHRELAQRGGDRASVTTSLMEARP